MRPLALVAVLMAACGTPSGSSDAGSSDGGASDAGGGLPAAFQLAARPFAEDVLLRAARAYERETEWAKRAPAL